MHEKMHVKLKKKKKEKKKKRGQYGHTCLWREKPCKKLGGKLQKICCGALPSQREREKSLKTFEKGELNKSRSNLKKSLFTLFD